MTTATAPLKVGDAVRVTEHNDQTRLPVAGGRVYGAEVTEVSDLYVAVRYTTPALVGYYGADPFYRESGWRAWDGSFVWRLVPDDCDHNVIDPHAKRCEDCGLLVSDELADAASERRAGCYRER